MMYSESEDQMLEMETKIMLQNEQVKKYYRDNWELIKPLWVKYNRKDLLNFNSNTNNIAEAVNSTLKQFIKRSTKMSLCMKKMLHFIDYEEKKINFGCQVDRM